MNPKVLILLGGCLSCFWGIVCGISQIRAGRKKRIAIGGQYAEDGEFPYQVLLTYNKKVRCGGSILSNDLILTAAHCVDDIKPSEIQISAGVNEHYLYGENRPVNKQVRSASHIHIHEDHNFVSGINDVAILELSNPLQYTAHVNRISLPRVSEEFSGNATATGWGRTEEKGSTSFFLRKVELPIVSNLECNRIYENYLREVTINPAISVQLNTALVVILNTTVPVIIELAVEFNITDTMMCAGGVAEKGICQGDSGGPLVCKQRSGLGRGKKGKSVICGIIQSGVGCGEDGLPGVFTQVSKFTDWIKNTQNKIMMRKKCTSDCSPNPDEKDGNTETKQEIYNSASSTGTAGSPSCDINKFYCFEKLMVHIFSIIIVVVILSIVLVFKFWAGGCLAVGIPRFEVG